MKRHLLMSEHTDNLSNQSRGYWMYPSVKNVFPASAIFSITLVFRLSLG